MNLSDRRGRDRGALEAREQLIHPRAELGADHLVGLRPRDWGNIVLQPAQLGDELCWQQVAAGGQHLTELDESDAARLRAPGEANGPAGRGPLRGGTPTAVRLAGRAAGRGAAGSG